MGESNQSSVGAERDLRLLSVLSLVFSRLLFAEAALELAKGESSLSIFDFDFLRGECFERDDRWWP